MFEILAHTDLSHQSILVSVHSGQLSYMGEYILQAIGKLESVDLGKPILNMRVNNQLS